MLALLGVGLVLAAGRVKQSYGSGVVGVYGLFGYWWFNNWFITHEEIVKGSRFTFQLDSRPTVR